MVNQNKWSNKFDLISIVLHFLFLKKILELKESLVD